MSVSAFIKKNILLFFLALLIPNFIYAQGLEATPQSLNVSENENFTIQYSIENTDIENFIPPIIPDELEVVSGPNKSSSLQIINGKMTSSAIIKYVLSATTKGNFTIEPAQVTAGRKKLKIYSNTIQVSVSGSPQTTQNASSNTTTNNSQSKEDAFLTLELNPTQAVKGQQITATYKLYSAIQILDYDLKKIPNFAGFFSSNISNNNVTAKGVTKINGKEYTEYELLKYALFPQKAGKLTITAPLVHIEGYASSGGFYRKNITIPNPTDIIVQPLPQPEPPNFSGAVGDYVLTTNLSKNTVQANQTIELELGIQGKGDIKTIQPPILPIIQHLETFDPKIVDDVRRINDLMGGIKTMTYSITPTQQGRYTIPIQFVFYSTKTNSYETITSSQPLEINVEPNPNDTTQSTVSFADTTNNNANAPSLPTQLKNSILKIITLLVILAGILFFFWRFKKRQKQSQTNTKINAPQQPKDNQNTQPSPLILPQQEPKPEHKPIQKYTTAEVLHKIKPLQQNPTVFYTEALNQLKHYFEINFDLPKNIFTQKTLTQSLEKKQISPETIQDIMQIISHIQEQLYAPPFLQNAEQLYKSIHNTLPNIEKNM